jgi:hypothetical protein
VNNAIGRLEVGCETWTLTLQEEYSVTVLEYRELMRFFGPKREQGIGRRRKLSNVCLHDL